MFCEVDEEDKEGESEVKKKEAAKKCCLFFLCQASPLTSYLGTGNYFLQKGKKLNKRKRKGKHASDSNQKVLCHR